MGAPPITKPTAIARSLLPSGLPSNPTYRKVNPADAPIMILALTSDTLRQGELYDAASTINAIGSPKVLNASRTRSTVTVFGK